MNYWLLIGCFFIDCVLCCAQNDQQFGIQSAIISYNHSGSGYGNSVLYFDDFGDRKAIQTIIRADSANGKILTRNNEVFINNEPVSENNMGTNTKAYQAESSLSNSITSSVFTSEMLNNLGFSESGKCMVVGKTCTRYISNNDTICLWKGIVLKASTHLTVVTINIEAVRIELKSPPDSVFQFITENFKH